MAKPPKACREIPVILAGAGIRGKRTQAQSLFQQTDGLSGTARHGGDTRWLAKVPDPSNETGTRRGKL